MSHADLSPSGSSRWLRCSASVGFINRLRSTGVIPKEETTAAADEGTLAHSWAAKALEAYDMGFDFVYSQIEDPLMANHIRSYVEVVTSKITGDGQLLIEQRMPLFYGYRGAPEKQAVIFDKEGAFWLRLNDADMKRIDEGPFDTWDEAKAVFVSDYEPLGYWVEECGTSDAIVLTDDALFIIDLKYGQGVSVDAKENEQVGIYAESFIKFRKLREKLPSQFAVNLIIFQPRDRSSDLPPERVWPTSFGELEELHYSGEGTQAKAMRLQGLATGTDGADTFAETVITDTKSGESFKVRGTLCAGKKQCLFCPVKARCGAYAAFSTAPLVDALTEFPDTIEQVVAGPWETPDRISEMLGDEKLAQIAVAHLEGRFTDWLNSIVKHVQARMMAGVKVSDAVKLVKAEKRRKWLDEEEALRLLRQKIPKDQLVEPKLVSPSQAWELVPKDASTKFKNKLNSLITKPEGEATLVLASDKRPALEFKPATAAEEFGDVITSETPAEADARVSRAIGLTPEQPADDDLL